MGARWELARQMRENGLKTLPDAPIYMSLINYTPIPDSWSTRRKNEFEGKPCITRPDVDNYLKFYSDVLNGIAYSDDKLITQVWSEKIYSATPRVEITLLPLWGSMINEHAITVKGDITLEELSYMVRKAHKIGKSGRELIRVFAQEDEEGKHIYFEVEGIKPKDLEWTS